MMKKSKKTAELEDIVLPAIIVSLDETVGPPDQDELQLMDELQKEWVEGWCKEVNKSRTKKARSVLQSKNEKKEHMRKKKIRSRL